MMPDLALDEIDLVVYARMLGRFLGDTRPLALCDPNGLPVWTSDGVVQCELDAICCSLKNVDPLDQGNGQALGTCELGRKRILVYQSFGGGILGSLGWLALVLEAEHPALEATAVSRLAESMADVARCIRTEYRLNTELNQMASELAKRYEELNLVYRAEDLKSAPRLEDSFQLLLEDCTDFLDVDLAALILPEQKFRIYHANPMSDTSGDSDEVLMHTVDQVYRRVTGGRKSLVLNSSQGSEQPKTPYKIVASPVLDAHARVCGALMFINHLEKPDFLNSDRNLVGVIAKRVSKLIQVDQDALTALINRAGFEKQVERALLSARQHKIHHALCLMNLDRFRLLNDAYGVIAGDAVLKQCALLIKRQLREIDIVGRTGGDEFGILLEGCSLKQAQGITEQLRQTIANTDFPWGDRLLKSTVSIGLIGLDADSGSLTEVLTAVDVAAQMAKDLGRNRLQVYQADDREMVQRRGEMRYANQIDTALEEDYFELFCQPIVPVQGGNLHFEILLRLRDTDGKFLKPGMFMGAAERYHRMPDIDRWVLGHAIEFLSKAKTGLKNKALRWGINLSGQSLAQETFLNFMIDRLKHSDTPVEWLYFEITETVAIGNFDQVLRFMTEIKDLGYRFALDDFGTGYSSFSYLKSLPFDYLKIDGAFVKHLDQDHFDQVTVASINDIAHALGLETIAEFVENEAILHRLRTIGVDFAQGYGVGMPRPVDEVLAELVSRPI